MGKEALNVGIYVYDEAEVLDFSGPFEVFSTASRLSGGQPDFNVFLVSELGVPVRARGGFVVTPSFSIDHHPGLDVLIVVGGVHTAEMTKTPVLEWISRTSIDVSYIASVCTGAFLLAEAGVISGIRVTTHWEDIPDLRVRYPDLTVIENQRWVDTGRIITSGGISAGIDMSLHLVNRIAGRALAVATARQMEFDWTENPAKPD